MVSFLWQRARTGSRCSGLARLVTGLATWRGIKEQCGVRQSTPRPLCVPPGLQTFRRRWIISRHWLAVGRRRTPVLLRIELSPSSLFSTAFYFVCPKVEFFSTFARLDHDKNGQTTLLHVPNYHCNGPRWGVHILCAAVELVGRYGARSQAMSGTRE